MKKILSAFLAVSMLFSLSAQNSPARRAYVDFVVIPSHSDAVYNLGDAAALKVVAQAGGKGLENVKISNIVTPDGIDEVGQA